MSQGNSRSVTSKQTRVHDRLSELVTRYQRTTNHRPVADHTLRAFERVQRWLVHCEHDLLLDAGCGTGQSTALLAQRYPQAQVVGLDRSAARLRKHQPIDVPNYLLVQADIHDFLRLARQNDWHVARAYLLYPNPYPKASQVQRRWHASPVMPDLMQISHHVEVRSNWRLYCEEFAHACSLYGWQWQLSQVKDNAPLTLFEKKYQQSGQICWRVVCEAPTKENAA